MTIDQTPNQHPNHILQEDNVNTHSTKRRRATLGLTLAAFSLVAAACGGDDGNDATPATDAPEAQDGPFGAACDAVPTDGEGSFGGMADDPAATAASNNPLLSTLVGAVSQAGLVDTLNGDGPFTIFAPTNDAFAAVPADQLDSVLADNDLLTSVLTYHVVGGQSLEAAGLGDAGSLETVNGATLDFGTDGTTVNGVNIVCSNVTTANATVHIIDGVLLPPAGDDMTDEMSDSDEMTDDMTDEMTDDMTEEMTDEAMAPSPFGPACASVPADGEGSFDGMADDPAATAASNNPVLSTLVSAVSAAGLVDTLNGEGPFTIFAPTNDAFAAIPADQLDAVLADQDLLTSILTLHVVAGQSLSAAELGELGTVDTVNGESLTVGPDGTTINGATAVCSDVVTANATVHIIDSVLLPGGPQAMAPSGPACASVPADGEGSFDGMADDPAATAASNNPVLSTLVSAVSAAGLVDTLNGEGPFTIFAPTNDAFAAIPADQLDAVLADQDLLTSILTLHVVAGERLSSADLIAAGSVDTVNGGSLEITDVDGMLTVDGVTSVCMDVPTANATVHIIEGVLLP